jgi:tetratricopeptide (TPR) repeat protein
MTLIARIVTLMAVLGYSVSAVAQSPSKEERFGRAVTLLQAGRYGEAIPMLEDLAKTDPRAANVFWNLGNAQTEMGAHAKALEAWKTFHRLEPDDWHGTEKLIQASYAAGRFADGDRERETFVKQWASTHDAHWKKATRFCRDIFETKSGKVAAFEDFEINADPAVWVTFSIQTGPRAHTSVLLVSDTSVDQKLRSKGRLGKDERIYTLSWTSGTQRETYRIYKAMPVYQDLRKDVIDALNGDLKPMSSVSVMTSGE